MPLQSNKRKYLIASFNFQLLTFPIQLLATEFVVILNERSYDVESSTV